MVGEGENMFKKKLSVVAALLVLGSASAYAGVITGSPHDLSATTTGVAVNGELCVFCHTPHAGNSAFTGAPLWNKASPTTDFTMYGATSAATNGQTIAQADTGVSDPSNSSLACLSCHDGVSSIDSIVNAPGSGLNSVTTVTSITTIGVNANANLTADLTNTHPISVTYIPGNASLKPTNTVLTGWQGAGTILDLLRGSGQDQVECGSCHDPHNGLADQATRSTEVNFLRHTNAGSALCLGCHDK